MYVGIYFQLIHPEKFGSRFSGRINLNSSSTSYSYLLAMHVDDIGTIPGEFHPGSESIGLVPRHLTIHRTFFGNQNYWDLRFYFRYLNITDMNYLNRLQDLQVTWSSSNVHFLRLYFWNLYIMCILAIILLNVNNSNNLQYSFQNTYLQLAVAVPPFYYWRYINENIWEQSFLFSVCCIYNFL